MKTKFLVALGALLLLAAPASAITIGNPPESDATPLPFNGGSAEFSSTSIEYQQLYAAGAFSGPITIQSLMFYSDQCCTSTRGRLFADGIFTLSLSTTSVNVGELSTNLASNIGIDNTQVFVGSLPYATPPESYILSRTVFPHTIEFDLTTPFSFDPSEGNLLLDVINEGLRSGFGDMNHTYHTTLLGIAWVSSNGQYNRAAIGGLVTGFNETSPDGFTNFVAGPPVPAAPITPLPPALPLFATGLSVLSLLGWLRKRCIRPPRSGRSLVRLILAAA